jgi:hypothetical protein
MAGQNHDYPITWNVFHEMNNREPRLASTAVRRAFHCLTLLLLPTILPRGILAGARMRQPDGEQADRLESEPAPYLPYIGAPPLRFLEALPPPAVAAPKKEIAEKAPPVKADLPPAAPVQAEPSKPQAEAANAEKDAPNAAPKAQAGTPPVPILPDTVRPQVQAEDFLPYFVIPGSDKGGDSTGRPPEPPDPARLPPSSATYTEK